MAVNLSPVGGVAAQFFDNSGNVLTGGKIYTYAAGTTTPAVTFTSSAGSVAWSNPIVLDASGRVSGSGEIWLTDGLSYKFLLKDSNDVLIATYDNITGINSNFVAFTNQQEIQTATAGQTVFNLTSTTYQPGTNSLSVFVDGVNQYGPGAQYAYLETDQDTVTFVNGLHVGAQVKFTTSQLNSGGSTTAASVSFTGFKNQVGNVQNLADDDGSDWIGFEPSGSGATARSAQDKMRDYISVKDFGATGDGVTDDAAAIQAAIDAAGDRDVFFPAGGYKIGTSIVLPSDTGIRLVGEGSATGTTAMAILPLGANNTDPNFASFTATGNLNNVSMERIRVVGGGYGILVDLDAGFMDKLYLYQCVFQENITACVAGVGASSPPPNGMYEIVAKESVFVTSGAGFVCPGAFNVNRIEDCSFEIMKGPYLQLLSPSPNPTSSVHFLRNRCETIGVTDTGQACIDIVGGLVTFNVVVDGNYFENVFQNIGAFNGVRNLVFTNNFQTNSSLITGQIIIAECGFDFYNNTSLSGVTVNLSTGTQNAPGLVYSNINYTLTTLRASSMASVAPMLIPSQGISLESVPTIYQARVNQVKFVALTNNTNATFFTFTGGSSSGTGATSRANMALRAIVLLNITDTGGVSYMATNEYLITVSCYAGTTFASTITTIVDQTAGKFTLTQTSANATSLVLTGKYNTGTGSTFTASARANVLYEYIADEISSSGIFVS